ncbi:MAG: hypothetical protein FWF94_08150 [Oscillospiraceae bacterium]|nr:hypothetical protein [Oscillospiraceae bacterium]
MKRFFAFLLMVSVTVSRPASFNFTECCPCGHDAGVSERCDSAVTHTTKRRKTTNENKNNKIC